jgi:hypothetical protein
MIDINDLIKMAMEPEPEKLEEQHSPTRKVYDAVSNSATVLGSGVVAGIASLNSLDQKAPPKTI